MKNKAGIIHLLPLLVVGVITLIVLIISPNLNINSVCTEEVPLVTVTTRFGQIYNSGCDIPWKINTSETKDVATSEDPTDNCELKPKAGSCKALIYKYYFNQESNSCEEFLWGGCDGVVPFQELSECQELCEQGVAVKPQKCGGIAGFACDEGYTCRMTETYPDAMGVCVEK